MAGVNTTGNYPKALWPGVRAFWGKTYESYPQQWPDLFEVRTSSQAYEEDVEGTGYGLAPVKPEAGAVYYDSDQQGSTKRHTHVAYALGFQVSYEEIQDNLYEKVANSRAEALAFAMRTTEETVCANVYNRAFDSNYVGGDGKELLATDHPTLDGTQQNELTVAADLSETAVEDLLTLIHQAKNTRGLRIMVTPQTLIVPPGLWWEANRILKSALQNDTANNATNVLKITNALPGGIKVNNFLTDPDAWFIRTNAPNGMIRFNREMGALQEDRDFDTMNVKYMQYMRFSVSWTDFRGLYGSPSA